MPIGELAKALGTGLKVYAGSVTGPSSYTAGGFTVTITGIRTIHEAVVSLRNNPGNKVIEYSWSGNTLTIVIKTISADTTTGAISATEDADGTDESGLTFDIVVVGE